MVDGDRCERVLTGDLAKEQARALRFYRKHRERSKLAMQRRRRAAGKKGKK